MKIKALILASAIIMPSLASTAQVNDNNTGTIVGQRKYELIVNEGNDSTVNAFNRGLEASRGNRAFLADIAGVYRSTFVGQAIGASTSLLELGISALMKAGENKQPKWQKAVMGESTFIRVLPMQMEILDFYREPSSIGPLDPSDMFFNGFGCRQVIEYTDAEGRPAEEEVFYVSCNVRTDSIGRMRMLNHSKFEVYVDSLRFNFALCDLPNDSLGTDICTRIPFSFEKRKDLKFIVRADITSSWITQAMQVYNDQPLGSFEIVASIDPDKLDSRGIFTYSSSNAADRAKRVSVKGDCFLVPRSYVGSNDMHTASDSWGTGQYKVEMQIAETCRINPDYYMTDGKWDKDIWGPEWKLISKRKPSKPAWRSVLEVVGVQYAGSNWISTLLEPTKTVIIQYETQELNRLINGGGAAAAPSKVQAKRP